MIVGKLASDPLVRTEFGDHLLRLGIVYHPSSGPSSGPTSR